MADVFISYAKEDSGFAEIIARTLKESGVSVWWDSALSPGDDFRQIILTELNSAQNVIVLWSPYSVTSAFVLDEANRGLMQSKLIPFMIAACEPPLGFGVLHYKVLSRENFNIGTVLDALGMQPSKPERIGLSEAQRLWMKMGNNPKPVDYADFLVQFPSDPLAVTARIRLAVIARIDERRQKRLEEIAKIPTPNIPDDLKKIQGVGNLFEAALNSFGVTLYKQLASWDADDVRKFETACGYLEVSKRLYQENWVEQAFILAKGGMTEFSRQVDRGQIVFE